MMSEFVVLRIEERDALLGATLAFIHLASTSCYDPQQLLAPPVAPTVAPNVALPLAPPLAPPLSPCSQSHSYNVPISLSLSPRRYPLYRFHPPPLPPSVQPHSPHPNLPSDRLHNNLSHNNSSSTPLNSPIPLHPTFPPDSSPLLSSHSPFHPPLGLRI